MKKIFGRIPPSSNEPEPAQQSSSPQAPAPGGDGLTEQNTLQAMRMELDARQERIFQLTQEIERLRERQEAAAAEMINGKLDALFAELAAPASQAITQADLLENQGKPVQARDILAVTRRLIRALERHGLTFDGSVGETVSFDPSRHTPIDSYASPQPGQPVTIRFAGVRRGEKVLYKAIVE